MRWLGLLALVACADPTPPAAPPSSAPKSAAAPASARPASSAPATTAAPKVDARARWAARVSQPLPKDLPKAWRAVIEATGAKVVSARHLVFTRTDDQPPRREVDLVLRVFGEDAANDAAMRKALAPWPDAKLEIDRVKGTPPRQSQYSIEWARRPANAPDAKPCKKPKALDLPAEAPRWLDRVTNARSTRRRVGVAVDRDAEGLTVEQTMRYRNGYARDEAIGHFRKAAERQGFTHDRGTGERQRWIHRDGRVLRWDRDNSELYLGCPVAGPVLVLTLHTPAG